MGVIKLHRRVKYAGDVHAELLKNGYTLVGATEFVNHIPDAVDVVEVVRCKDCVSFCDCGTYYLDNGCLNVNGLSDPKEDDFCPYGERKDNDQD